MSTMAFDELHTLLDTPADPTACWLLRPPEEDEWPCLLAYLPPDLEASATRYGAFLRARQIPSAATLLRLTLAYACGYPLRTVAARATELGLVEHFTDNALHERLERLVPWMSYLVGQQLAGAAAAFPWDTPLHICLCDATTLARPGATGTDWRLHLGLDLRTGLIDHLSVTGANIGEHLADFPLAPGDVVLADRGYATRQGLAAVQARGAYSLVRLAWQNVPLQHADGRPFDLFAALHTLAPGTWQVWTVQTAPTADLAAVPGRLVVGALPEEAANQARAKVRQAATKHGKTPTAATLEAAGYVLLFTTVPEALLSPVQVLALYRLRWQVEVAFKRDKSVLHLAEIRAMTDRVCYTVILAKCLLLLLLDRLAGATGLFSPSGDAAAPDEPRSPVSGLVSDPPGAPVAATADAGLVPFAAECAEALFYRAPTPADRAA